ncbi:unnamed protein product [Bemisia tabaci]|uniref:1-phosphatidylinositol-3-phosphate 5-kinase n=1 Tax=Bemisia tabaci TaxID=7038 RepID=A0A9P0AD39_BEMTA|nr:unnamed protein product [Bemisia tabaci]
MSRNLDSLTSLTEFDPPSPEPKEPSVSSMFFKFFSFSKGDGTEDTKSLPPAQTSSESSNNPSRSESSEQISDKIKSDLSDTVSLPDQLQSGANEGRSLPNVLKRVRNLVALRNTGLQAYKDTDLQQYWMPDSKSKECYDCSCKFTLLIRRHHCRVCGQIFCYRCCNQEIPGKIMNCTGDLRVCTYCCKVVLSYLQSADVDADLSADLRALQEDLQSKFGSNSELSSSLLPSESPNNPTISHKLSTASLDSEDTAKRKTSVGYQEERFAQGRSAYFGFASSPSIDDKFCRSLQNSASLQSLVDEMKDPANGLSFQTYKHRSVTCYSCLLGYQLVDWLHAKGKVTSRSLAVVVCQALLEANLIECASAELSFVDGPALYRFCSSSSGDSDTPTWEDITNCNSTDSNIRNFSNDSAPSNPDGSFDNQRLYPVDTSSMDSSTSCASGSEKKEVFNLFKNTESKDFLTMASLKNLINAYQEREPHIRPVNWHIVNPQALRSDFQEAKVFIDLRNAFTLHRQKFLSQLLASAGLPLSWSDVVIPLVDRVVEDVKPDVSENLDIIDIRQYVQVKKVVGGSRQESFVVGGVVFTKNIAHRGMANRLINPRILLIQCPIVYQRIEGRLLSLEPVMMQEHEYLRHVVSRIASLKPDVVLVHRNVSRIAQESLYDLNITLILNVKLSVLERIARCTRADIITSVDAFFGKPHLGTCHYFHVETFINEAGLSKTLVFFEGCAFPHRGSTVILRGHSSQELSKLKVIMNQLIYMSYNWRLENSFLMDEFARPPNFSVDSFLKESPPSTNLQKNIETREPKPKFSVGGEDTEDLGNLNMDEEVKPKKSELTQDGEFTSLRAIKNQNNEKTSKNVISDYSDPLHIYLNSEDQCVSNMYCSKSDQALSIAEVPRANSFRKILDETILCVSPFLTFTIPYLETEAGKNCELRKYFPAESYYSPLLSKDESAYPSHNILSKQLSASTKGPELEAPHPFTIAKITAGVKENEVQKLLALYRACGSRIKSKAGNKMVLTEKRQVPEKLQKQSLELEKKGKLDALDPANHQRLPVLFCSFSHKSNNAPAFCVTPWIVNIDFYGRNDIPLGRFLERYCFRTAYKCPSDLCETSMLDHERRFVHQNGCVLISLQEISSSEKPILEERILLWSWCPICGIVTPIVPMSSDAWALSFGKYLELKFYGNMYTCRAFPEERCKHSLHHDYSQYFAFGNRVACFKYMGIMIWEISLPPPILTILPSPHQQEAVLDEMKKWACMGHEVFSNVLEKLHAMGISNDPSIQTFKQQMQKDQAYFKLRVEEIQVKLVSPTLEKSSEKSPTSIQTRILELQDSVTNLKKMVVEYVGKWNARILKAESLINMKKKDEKSKKNDSKSISNPELVLESTGKADADSVTSSSTVEESIATEDHGPNIQTASWEVGMEVEEETKRKSRTSIEMDEALKVPAEVEKSGGELSPKTDKKQDDPILEFENELSEISDVFCSVVPESSSSLWSQEKKAVKNILLQLLPGAAPDLPIQCPTSATEHYALKSMVGSSVPVIVYESEPSSIIAHALSMHDYRIALSELQNKSRSTETQPSPNTSSKKRHSGAEESGQQGDGKKQKVFSFLRTQNSSSSTVSGKSSSENTAQPFISGSDEIETEESVKHDVDSKSKTSKQDNASNLEVQFSDATASFIVKIYKAEEFHNLRSLIFPAGEEAYIRSLSRCVQWAARGGKSGSNFSKTKDDRFILKEMSRQETHLFLEFAPHYFNYVQNCQLSNQPTLLGKIVGVYRVTHKNNVNSNQVKSNLLVMENLFYGRTITHKFDLKGSVRNRLVTLSSEQDGEIVLLDENFINMTCNSPLYVHPHAKAILNSAINSDTNLLAQRMIMDYSLLVGLDENKKELVVGIIDYIRTFTWDKKVEAMVKKSGLLGGQGKLPTIVSPNLYRERFITAMDGYFLLVPNRWSDLEVHNLSSFV